MCDDVFTVDERIAEVDERIAEVEAMKEFRERMGSGGRFVAVFVDRLGDLYDERRRLQARREQGDGSAG